MAMTEKRESAGAIEASVGTIGKGRGFLTESIEELKKVHTPTRQETIRHTWVVLLIIAFVSFCLFLLDIVFGWVMKGLLG